jgi:hypothetical protein
MKFDRIIGNPPYDGNLHLKILKQIVTFLNDDGEIVWIHPARWAQDPLAIYKKNSDYNKFKDLSWQEFEIMPVIEANAAFGTGFQSDLMISVIGDKKTDLESVIDLPCRSIIKKLLSHNDRISDHIDTKVDNGIRVKIRKLVNSTEGQHGLKLNKNSFSIVSLNFENVFIGGYTRDGTYWQDVGIKNGQIKEFIPNSIEFNSLALADNFIKSVSADIFIAFIFLAKKDTNMPLGYLPYMGDYSKVWTNEDYTKYFGFTPEEVNYLSKTLDRYKR